MISDAYVTITCDECNREEDIQLISTAGRGAYDMRNVDDWRKWNGWVNRAGLDLCEDCADEEDESSD